VFRIRRLTCKIYQQDRVFYLDADRRNHADGRCSPCNRAEFLDLVPEAAATLRASAALLARSRSRCAVVVACRASSFALVVQPTSPEKAATAVANQIINICCVMA
jgi:hypothetical protein